MTTYRTVSIDGLDIFYREAGSRDNPTILLLHGFPTSSHMFRNLIPALADKFHLVAPDYPGYGNSSMPTVSEFDYTFDRLAEIVGVRNLEAISPDTWTIDQHFLDRPGNGEIQLALLYSYGTNPPLYPQWQDYFRQYQPPTLIVWGKNDYIFPADGAYPYQRDLKDVEFHLLDTGHFALEEDGDAIANYIDQFLTSRLQSVLA